MNFRLLTFLIIAIFIFLYCSSSKKTVVENDISLSNLYHKSENTNLFYKLPAGWREIKDNYKQLFELWLISPNDKSTVAFIPIHLEDTFNDVNIPELSKLLLSTKKKIKQASLKNFSIIDEGKEFNNNEINFISLKYLDDGETKRSVIFGKDKLFYECLAYFESDYEPTDDEINNLFEIQQQILLSLQMK